MTNPQLFLPKPQSIQPHPHWHMGAGGSAEMFDLGGKAGCYRAVIGPVKPPSQWGRERERQSVLISVGQVESVKLIIEVN